MMKKVLSVLLAVLMAISVTGGMTVYAADSIDVGETVKVTIPANSWVELSFTPEVTGIYCFESHAETGDPGCEIWLDDMPVALNDDIYYDEDDEANADYNFFVSAILEAGETYTLFMTEFDGKKTTFTVTASFYAAVTDVTFTPAASYTYIDKTEMYYFDFNKGDRLSVATDQGTFTYQYNGEVFVDNNGEYLTDFLSADVGIYSDFDMDDDSDEILFNNQVNVRFFHYTFTFDTVTVPNPVKSISYKSAKPLRVLKNLTGGWDYDEKGRKYYYYDVDFANDNDVLTVNYTDGKTVKYTCRTEKVVEDGEIVEWDIHFVNSKGEALQYDYFDYYDTQYENHWQLGINYLIVSYMGRECKVPVEVINTGWYSDGGKWYYYHKTSGKMLTGWQKIDGKWYYFNGSGVMQTGWQKLGGKWYYMNSSGAMLTGWQKLGGKWYYMNSSGAMLTGWQKLGGKWYYFNSSGAMLTGWQKIGGTWYYFNSGGDMKTGWLKSGGKWYFLKSSGAMATSRVIVGGKTYYFNASGVCTNP